VARTQTLSEAAAAVESALDALRRGQRLVSRNPRAAVEAAVTQLLRGAFRGLAAADEHGTEYRIDDLARRTGVTTRNIRAYQERGLLPPARRAGRVSLFNDNHVARLTIITSMLERGYTSSHIREMLDAWEHGKDLSQVLGLESALVRPWGEEEPATVTVAEARELAGGKAELERLVADKLVSIRGQQATLHRPQLLQAFAEMRSYGMPMDTVLGVHERIEPMLDEISTILVNAGAAHVAESMTAESITDSEDLAGLIAMLVRFRTLAMTSVTATLEHSLETTIEKLLGDHLITIVDLAPHEAAL
jgi:DNA-binding transcriptional MerR regulator